MIVFDLRCTTGSHVFEAWFASSAAWEEQQAQGQISCPVCGSSSIEKAVMAPSVARKGNSASGSRQREQRVATGLDSEKSKAMLSMLAQVQKALLSNSTWVGKSFDEKARAMDAGEVTAEPIHGEVTMDQAKSLIEDGINVLPLPLPIVPPEKRN